MKTLKYAFAFITSLSLFLLPSCQENKTEECLSRYQKVEALKASNIDMIKVFYKLLDEQKFEACNKLFSSDSKGYMGSSETPVEFKDILPFIQMYYLAFPDYKHKIENIFTVDDYVVAQLRYTGTHSNRFMGIESTGKHIDYKGIFIFKLIDGKIIESWGIEDDLAMMRQLGLELK